MLPPHVFVVTMLHDKLPIDIPGVDPKSFKLDPGEYVLVAFDDPVRALEYAGNDPSLVMRFNR